MAEKEYIERDRIVKFIENGLNDPDKTKAFGHDAVEILAEIHLAPAADVAPVVHGEWVKSSHHTICSVCERKVPYKKIKRGYHLCWKSAFCPHCGAKMKGE